MNPTIFLAALAASVAVAAAVFALIPRPNIQRFTNGVLEDSDFGSGWFGYWNRLDARSGGSGQGRRAGLIAATSAILGALLLFTVAPAASLVGLALGPLLLRAYFGKRTSRRRQALNAQLPPFLFSLASALRRGATLEAAIISVAGDAREPLRGSLSRLVIDLDLGVPFSDAMASWAGRTPSPTAGVVAVNLIMAHQSGGVADLQRDLTELGQQVAEENSLMKMIHSKQTQSRLVGRVLIGMPILGLLAAYGTFGPEAFTGIASVLVPLLSVGATFAAWWATAALRRWQFASVGDVL